MLKVILNKGEEKRIIDGHPWVFSNEVRAFEGEIKAGTICDCYSYDNRFIGRGFFNSNSKIMVRILSRSQIEIDKEFFYDRIKKANDFRLSIGLDDNYRVCFSESDGLPGLIIDKYGKYLVIQIMSLGLNYYKEIILDILIDIFNPLGIYERSDVSVRKKEGLEEFKGTIYGEVPDIITICENGILINVDVKNGQKTGYFLDQKMNRKAVGEYSKNRCVLDLFSHTGGFGLNAKKMGAKFVTCVDISEKACEDIKVNISLNNYDNMAVVCADVFDFLRLEENKNKYDLIILDPPAFTKDKNTVEAAYRGYKDINLRAMKIVRSNGIICTFSCSQHMTPSLFMEMINDARIDSKREVRLIDFRIQSPDHPTMLESSESWYLKCAILLVK